MLMPENNLQILRTRDLLPTVEVDLDSNPINKHGYGNLVVAALAAVASQSPKLRATIYVYQGPSVNFHQQTWSAFFGVAGNQTILDVLFKAFQQAKVDRFRFSDDLDPSTATKDFHIEKGYVWRPYEPGTWYAQTEEKTDIAGSTTEKPDQPHHFDLKNHGDAQQGAHIRHRAARADASIGTLRRRWE
jgi:hypothetical protein